MGGFAAHLVIADGKVEYVDRSEEVGAEFLAMREVSNMTEHVEGDDCPECRKMRELELQLNAVLDGRSDIPARNKARSLLMFALIELLPVMGADRTKRELRGIMATLFQKLDANADAISERFGGLN